MKNDSPTNQDIRIIDSFEQDGTRFAGVLTVDVFLVCNSKQQ